MQALEILDAGELAQARALLAQGPWADGRTSAGPQAAAVKRNRQLGEGPALQQLRALVLQALERQPLFLSAALPRRVLPPLFNRYGGALNEYGAHVDQAIRVHEQGPLRADISCTLFLAEPDSYAGGELLLEGLSQLPGWPGWPGLPGPPGLPGHPGIKLRAGHALLYPAHTVHRVAPVTQGERLACCFWVESLVRRADQRQLLFEMDMALLRLRQRALDAGQPESAEVVALTGTYHNLLRQWAET